MYAGDTNHEAHVIQTILSKYNLDYEGSGIDVESPQFLEDFVENNLDKVYQLLSSRNDVGPEIQELIKEDPRQAAQKMLYEITVADVLEISGASPEEAAIGAGSGDTRLFAKKNWGWKRVQGDNVETWTLTPKDIQAIARGMGDIMDGYYGEDEETDPTIQINVESNGSWYTDVPMSVLDSHQAATLIQRYGNMRGNVPLQDIGYQPQAPSGYYKNYGD
jgi:hypothetical protein